MSNRCIVHTCMYVRMTTAVFKSTNCKRRGVTTAQSHRHMPIKGEDVDRPCWVTVWHVHAIDMPTDTGAMLVLPGRRCRHKRQRGKATALYLANDIQLPRQPNPTEHTPLSCATWVVMPAKQKPLSHTHRACPHARIWSVVRTHTL